MELLNSKIDHKDYQCNRVEWGVELAKRLIPKTLNCCLIFITCRSWKAISSGI